MRIVGNCQRDHDAAIGRRIAQGVVEQVFQRQLHQRGIEQRLVLAGCDLQLHAALHVGALRVPQRLAQCAQIGQHGLRLHAVFVEFTGSQKAGHQTIEPPHLAAHIGDARMHRLGQRRGRGLQKIRTAVDAGKRVAELVRQQRDEAAMVLRARLGEQLAFAQLVDVLGHGDGHHQNVDDAAQRVGVEREVVGRERAGHGEHGDAHAQREEQKGQHVDQPQPVAQTPPHHPGQQQMQRAGPHGDLIGGLEHLVVVLGHGQREQGDHQNHRADMQLRQTWVELGHVEDVDPQQRGRAQRDQRAHAVGQIAHPPGGFADQLHQHAGVAVEQQKLGGHEQRIGQQHAVAQPRAQQRVGDDGQRQNAQQHAEQPVDAGLAREEGVWVREGQRHVHQTGGLRAHPENDFFTRRDVERRDMHARTQRPLGAEKVIAQLPLLQRPVAALHPDAHIVDERRAHQQQPAIALAGVVQIARVMAHAHGIPMCGAAQPRAAQCARMLKGTGQRLSVDLDKTGLSCGVRPLHDLRVHQRGIRTRRRAAQHDGRGQSIEVLPDAVARDLRRDVAGHGVGREHIRHGFMDQRVAKHRPTDQDKGEHQPAMRACAGRHGVSWRPARWRRRRQ